ncbi:FAD/NAD(P)-binding protein [Albimonas pacifica]|uniref:Uncharacterized NAD(P)/FAD-binding protein YdhS n=1 Tax=Albimonas pacifica TaxID=1114924 RepID=A0A1I3PR64_9RHOB|nr:FAD/NAD(P)-binding protein [Albimonas pacifica]SFJ24264.1 Uncharacterized NAD(P)/FAD-binding protein YdhS [Albimonas pacifica]
MRQVRIAILGAGVSAASLLRGLTAPGPGAVDPADVAVFGVSEGAAFGVPAHFAARLDPRLLLNNSLQAMSAPEFPFADWLRGRGRGAGAPGDPAVPGASAPGVVPVHDPAPAPDADDATLFLPRRRVGAFLSQTVGAAAAPALAQALLRPAAAAVDLDPATGRWIVRDVAGGRVSAARVAMATGGRLVDPAPPRAPRWAQARGEGALAGRAFLGRLDGGAGGRLAIVGGGPSAGELAALLGEERPDARLTAISADGLMPNRAAGPDTPDWTGFDRAGLQAVGSAAALAAFAAAQVAAARREGGPWSFAALARAVFAHARALPPAEALAFRHVHADRARSVVRWMPPAYHRRLQEMQAEGRLEVLAGRVSGVVPAPGRAGEAGGLDVVVDGRPSGRVFEAVFDCTAYLEGASPVLTRGGAPFGLRRPEMPLRAGPGGLAELAPGLFPTGNALSPYSAEPGLWGRVEHAPRCTALALAAAAWMRETDA